MDFREVSVSDIRVNPIALRTVYEDSDQFTGLCQSVAQKGVMTPIEVREKTEDGVTYYEICDGAQRFAAATRAGKNTVPVQVISATDDEVEERQLELNLHKVDTKPIDYTKHLIKMLSRNPLMSEQQLADKVNASLSFVQTRLGLLKLTADVQLLVNAGDIPVTSAIELARLPKEEQAQWVEEAISKKPAEFVPEVKERLKEIRKAAREGKKAEPKGYQPVPKLRTKAEIVAAYEDPASESQRPAFAWVLQLDEASIVAAKADYEAKAAARTEKAAKKKAEDEARKAKEAQEKAEAAQAEVDAMFAN